MTADTSPSAIARKSPGRFGCLVRVAALAVVAVVVFVVLGIAFGGGDGGGGGGGPSGYNAGRAEAYARSDVTYREQEHLYVVRFADGEFLALYDLSPKQQELGSRCRVSYDESASLGGLSQLAGFRGAFVENCESARAVWRADGKRAFGSGYGDLDRFPTAISDAGDLIVDTSERSCTKSRGVIGIEPFDVRTCRGRPR